MLPRASGTGGRLQEPVPVLNGLRRDVLANVSGEEVRLGAVGVDALSDMRRLADDLPRGEHTGARAWERALHAKVTSLFDGGFEEVFYLFDVVGDLNPYKWPTVHSSLCM